MAQGFQHARHAEHVGHTARVAASHLPEFNELRKASNLNTKLNLYFVSSPCSRSWIAFGLSALSAALSFVFLLYQQLTTTMGKGGKMTI